MNIYITMRVLINSDKENLHKQQYTKGSFCAEIMSSNVVSKLLLMRKIYFIYMSILTYSWNIMQYNIASMIFHFLCKIFHLLLHRWIDIGHFLIYSYCSKFFTYLCASIHSLIFDITFHYHNQNFIFFVFVKFYTIF